MDEYLFVYGTLKRGYCRSFALQNAEYLGIARTFPEFRLYDCGEYPALVRAHTDGRSIAGELYRVPSTLFPLLDDLEGVSERLYHREQIAIQSPHHQLSVIAYLYDRPITGLRDLGESWP